MTPLFVFSGTTERMWELVFVLPSAEFSQPGHTLPWRTDMEGIQFTFCPPPACSGSKGQLLPHGRAGKAAGPQRWLCGSLNIAILHPPPGGLCSEMGDLLFRSLSAGDKGLCCKVFSLFKGISFNFKVQETPWLCHAAEGEPGWVMEKGLGAVQQTSHQEGNPGRAFMLHTSHFTTPSSLLFT